MDSRPSDDHALFAAMARGDADALGALYDRHGGILMALCLRIVKDVMAAEEVLEDAFWQAWRQAAQFDATRGSPLAFLVNIARSRAIDRLRSLRKQVPHTDGAAPAGRESAARVGNPLAQSPLSAAEGTERRQLVLRALAGLSADQRQVVTLGFFDAMSHSEIAKKLGQPLGTVKTRMRQAFVHLREVLRQTYGPPAVDPPAGTGAKPPLPSAPPDGGPLVDPQFEG